MKVRDKMTRNVRVASPDDTIQQVARVMAECDAGALPVGRDDRLVGMVTDRDIAVRGVAQGKDPDTPVRDVMTPEVRYVFEDGSLRDAADSMAREQVRRLPVVDRDKRVVGIISLGDLAEDGDHGQRTGERVTSRRRALPDWRRASLMGARAWGPVPARLLCSRSLSSQPAPSLPSGSVRSRVSASSTRRAASIPASTRPCRFPPRGRRR